MNTQLTTREALYAYENPAQTRPRGLAGLVAGLCIWLLAVTVVVTNLA